jgi:ABC-type Zn2+ transport system substrate-binding protein/surface adhesin
VNPKPLAGESKSPLSILPYDASHPLAHTSHPPLATHHRHDHDLAHDHDHDHDHDHGHDEDEGEDDDDDDEDQEEDEGPWESRCDWEDPMACNLQCMRI